MGSCVGRTETERVCLLVPEGLGARRAEMTAPFAFAEEGDALAPQRVLTRLLALVEARDSFRGLQEHLAGAGVTFEFGTDFSPRSCCICKRMNISWL